MDIDYALAWQFVDLDGRPRRLRFRRDDTEAADVLSGTRQLIAVIADPHRTDHDDTIAITRAGVDFAAVEHVLDGWRDWAKLGEEAVNLGEFSAASTEQIWIDRRQPCGHTRATIRESDPCNGAELSGPFTSAVGVRSFPPHSLAAGRRDRGTSPW
jgi:hypothetical protein